MGDDVGHKPWDRAWKRVEKAREKRRWRRELWWDGQVKGVHLLPAPDVDPTVLPPSAAITSNKGEPPC